MAWLAACPWRHLRSGRDLLLVACSDMQIVLQNRKVEFFVVGLQVEIMQIFLLYEKC